jgi:hypothetical protein
MRNAVKWLVAPALALAFLAAVVWIVMTPLQMGDAYPPYSTLRSDPQGAKILFDSLSELPDLRVERNYKRLGSLRASGPPGTLFFLGGSGPAMAAVSEPQLKEWEGLASDGWRLVFVFSNALPRMDANFDAFVKKDPKKEIKVPPLQSRWGVRFRLRTATVKERAEMDRTPRTSALYFESDASWRSVSLEKDAFASHLEKPMGKGSVALVARIFPISNEGLRERPHSQFVSELVGPNRRVVFDELHHGLDETGSVGSLIRRYRMQGVVGLFIVLGLLFIWRNSTSLLPFKDARVDAGEVLGRDSKQGMLTLLQRSVRRESLLDVCLAEWERAGPLLPMSQGRATPSAPSFKEGLAEGYRKIYQLLQERK